MVRTVYFIAVFSLLGASAVTASGIADNQCRLNGGAGFVLLTYLQR